MIKFEKILSKLLWSLLGVAGITACSNDTELEGEMEGEYPVVKTQFAITVPLMDSKTSRMPDNYVQQGTGVQFLGLNNIWLVPFKKKLTAGSHQDIYRKRLIALPASQNYTYPSAQVNVYDNVIVPEGTRQFLLYAEAYQKLVGIGAGYFQTGLLNNTLQQSLSSSSDIQFSLQQCFNDNMGNPESLWFKQATALKNGVNGVLRALEAWKASPIESRKNLYVNFKRLEAGSAYMIRETMLSLWESLKDANVIGEGTAAADGTVEAVKAAIVAKDPAVSTDPALFKNEQLDWRDDQLPEFPCLFDLPIGAVQMEYDPNAADGNGELVYMNVAHLPSPYAAKLLDICNPPQLVYYSLTDVAVKDEQVNDWSNIWTTQNFTGWGDEVQLSTKALALKEKVQYGVAALEAKFWCQENQLPDNGLELINVPKEGFPVTGILVGGQPNVVGWNFESIFNEPNSYDRLVYDRMHNIKDMTDPNKAYVSGLTADHSGWSKPNYTLLLKSKDMEPVSVLVELKNTSGQVIHGIDNGLIPKNAPFYLLAVLQPKTPIEIQNGGQTITVDNPSLFIPDVTTAVNFKISSLKHAYLTIPDLRGTQMEVGMYVDLEWKTSRIIQANIGE